MIESISHKSEYSTGRLDSFKSHLSQSSELTSQSSFCIYATGSYGRLEAAEHSDLDLFFLTDKASGGLSKISKTLIDADIIKACREMRLPEFSGDGEYLEVHSTEDLYSELGSRKDDYHNFFSARMLLLLESRPIFNDTMYNQTLRETIDSYYKDFIEHEDNFKPVYLVNDVIRFWRTMCLNYEHNRTRKAISSDLDPREAERKRSEIHIKNLKLKFSRKLTCYSFLLSVLYSPKPVLTQDDIMDIIIKTPLQRLESLLEFSEIRDDVSKLISHYFWFLETTQKDKKTLIDWISNQTNRNGAFEKSRDFAKLIFKIMIENSNRDNLMYFLI